MVVDAVRSYFDAASGLTELTRKRAVAAAKTLLKSADDRVAGQQGRPGPQVEDGNGAQHISRVGHDIQSLASELIETSQANRAALGALVESEVIRVLDRLDLVPRDEYERVVRRVAELERRVATRRAATPLHAQTAGVPTRPASTEVPATTDGSPSDANDEPSAGSGVAETPDVTDGKATTDPESADAGADSDAADVKGGEPAALSGSVGDQTAQDNVPNDHADQDGDPHPGDEKDRNEWEASPEADTEPLSDTGTKSTRTSSKQAGSKTTSKSGKSKSATKRSGARARTTAPAKKSEQ